MSSSSFYSPEKDCLTRDAEIEEELLTFEQIWGEKQKELCKNWIKENTYTKVCLQFPDSYLTYSTKICDDLKMETNSKCFILADTSYGSCCVDEIASAHVNADALIHFGAACKTKVSGIDTLYVFPHLPFDWNNFHNALATNFDNGSEVIVYFDISYQYLLDAGYQNKIDQIGSTLKKMYVSDSFPCNKRKEVESNQICLFVGQDNQQFFNLSMSIRGKKWYIYDPPQNTLKETCPTATNWIKRRYFYIEKCKDAKTLGLIVATLTSDGYLDVVKHIQEMARSRRMKTYLISVGRINPAKLANFMEIDCFVLIGCPFNNLYTSRDFFKPIVSVFEAEMALNPAWRMKIADSYTTNIKDILPDGKFYNEFKAEDIERHDVSLITGAIRNVQLKSEEENGNSNGILSQKGNYQLMTTGGDNIYDDRTWKGLQQYLGQTEPAKIKDGLSGIPISYE